ncbi:MAG: hypothetical protein GY716_07200 [bacterium]|nr:hypothetical protein [bacterium]
MRASARFLLLGALVATLPFDAAAPAGPSESPPRPLTERGRENLVALTRLIGYVRYFHPSDQAAEADWGLLAIAGVDRVESADDAGELAAALENLFQPIAPTVRVVPTGLTANPPAHAPVGPAGRAWLHHWQSERVDPSQPSSAGKADLWRSFDVADGTGKTVRFRAAARSRGPAELYVATSSWPQRSSDEVALRVIESADWQRYELTATVPEGVTTMEVGISLAGSGEAWLDDVSVELTTAEGRPAQQVFREGFEDGLGHGSSGWELAAISVRGLYAVETIVRNEPVPEGRTSARIDGTQVEASPFRTPDDPLVVSLPGGVTATIPLTVYADDEGTLPRVEDAAAAPRPERPEGWVPSGLDRATRLAIVALAWNVPQHFFPYFDVIETDWDAALIQALAESAVAPDELSLLRTLQQMLTALHDGHAQAYHPSGRATVRPPIVWRWIEDRLIVIHVVADLPGIAIEPGDEIVALDGVPIGDALDAMYARTPGATWQWRRHMALMYLAAGSTPRPVRFDVASPAGKRKSVTLDLAPGTLALAGPRPEPLHPIRPNILYVDLSRLTTEEFESALPQLVDAEAIVFDVRSYPRVDVTTVLAHIAERAVACPPHYKLVISAPDRVATTPARSRWWVTPRLPRVTARIAFITGGEIISTGETFMSIVKHYGLGTIVGGATAGTNGGAYREALPGGYRFNWTGSRIVNHDGTQLHGIGVLPDVPVTRTRQGVADGRDELLDAAVEWLERALPSLATQTN